ncbi:Ger(x)C family spore germination protein [Marininema halotolerans]|uniref:Germination protein, Ger(X)C family n=1 Tax=Marininema halotolerans TaxID=1155944 RepID=A0A1I6TZ71_9BACL|nr:Ger(x)C family spore germination C-terminal domain-containing protein [Marininema halotolerans]SFS94388.1 germination protein, Ger(x)C family [Marininema halotolerans]
MKERFQRCALLSLSLLLLFVASGCWSMKEISRQYYITSVGVDWHKGKYTAYAQISDFSSVAMASGGSGGKGPKFWTVKGEGPTVDSAVHSLYMYTEGLVSWGHVTAIIVSERLLKHGMRDVCSLVNRFYDARYLPWVYATDDSLENVLSITPVVFDSPTNGQLQDPDSNFRLRSFIPPIRYFEMIRLIGEPGQTPGIPGIRVKSGPWSSGEEKAPTLIIDHYYGLSNYHELGKMESNDLAGLRWMKPQTVRANVVIRQKGKPIADVVGRNTTIEIHSFVDPHKHPGFDIEIKGRGILLSMQKPLKREALEGLAEKEIAKQVRYTYEKALEKKFDIYDLSYEFYYHHPREWKRLNQHGGVTLNKDSLRSIKIDMSIVSGAKAKIDDIGKKHY